MPSTILSTTMSSVRAVIRYIITDITAPIIIISRPLTVCPMFITSKAEIRSTYLQSKGSCEKVV